MSNDKQQTAVEWLIETHKKFREEPWKYVNSGGEEAIFEQAKEMEKQQIETAYQAGDGDAYNLEETKTWAEQYYNDKYGGNK
jgi:hypothetical protein